MNNQPETSFLFRDQDHHLNPTLPMKEYLQPKPATGNAYTHHPSCRENDKDLVWHCNQCGLNESAADIEATLETSRYWKEQWVERGAQLAAEREATVAYRDLWHGSKHGKREQQLRDQLAAEREKVDNATENCMSLSKLLHERTQQLAAEREALATVRELRDLDQKQLAAERERHGDEMTSVQLQLNKQLAAEREKVKQHGT